MKFKQTHPSYLLAAILALQPVAVAGEIAPTVSLPSGLQPTILPAPLLVEARMPVELAKWEVSRHTRDSLRFRVSPLSYYRVTLKSQLKPEELGGIIFFDANGQEMAADNYLSLSAGASGGSQEFFFRANPFAASALVRFLMPGSSELKIADLKIETAMEQDVLRWQQNQLTKLPALRYDLDAARLSGLPLTRQRLQNGGPLRIVMLGDSIINDTSNSLFEVLLRRRYPRTQITVIPSIRGATGCWYYQEEDRVRDYVVRHEPDLLMIGGISHQNKPDAIGEVIRQTRAALGPKMPEVLVMTGPISLEEKMRRDFLAHSNLPREEAIRKMEEFKPRLREIVARQGATFLDIREVYEQYVQESGLPPKYFMRDETHADMNGKLVLGMILDRYFAPK